MIKSKLCIIIPFKNRLHLLKKTIDSVEAQTNKNFELILVNDGGESPTFIENCDLEIGIPQSVGQYEARKRGAFHAQTEFVYFLDSDDQIFPDFVETFYKHTDADLIFTTPVAKVYDCGVVPLGLSEKMTWMNGVAASQMIFRKKMARKAFDDLDLGNFNNNECFLYAIQYYLSNNPQVRYVPALKTAVGCFGEHSGVVFDGVSVELWEIINNLLSHEPKSECFMFWKYWNDNRKRSLSDYWISKIKIAINSDNISKMEF